ncbi:hypothetical protein OUZ56_024230 [Daphnia magna]|uniref:Uncharacterized protein n=1 Tax=Daphnia magna TaxID=35525 RepID=A0ABR0B0D3_9CRUS|nr:hypothetical protein OUZ56_024230 [Daphnia magna]
MQLAPAAFPTGTSVPQLHRSPHQLKEREVAGVVDGHQITDGCSLYDHMINMIDVHHVNHCIRLRAIGQRVTRRQSTILQQFIRRSETKPSTSTEHGRVFIRGRQHFLLLDSKNPSSSVCPQLPHPVACNQTGIVTDLEPPAVVTLHWPTTYLSFPK